MSFGINPPSGSGPSPIGRTDGDKKSRSVSAAPATADNSRREDAASISEVGRFASEAKALEPVRTELVASIREQIRAGTFDTPEKFQVALDRMIDEHGLLEDMA